MTTFLLLPDSSRFAEVGWPRWRLNCSWVHNCCCSLPAQSPWSQVPKNTRPYLPVSSLRLPQSGRPCSGISIPPEAEPPNYTLRHWVVTSCQSQSQSYLTTDRQSASLFWYQATIWDRRPLSLSLPWNLSSHSCGFVPLLPLWWEVWSVVFQPETVLFIRLSVCW
jgi:hypothetical protein